MATLLILAGVNGAGKSTLFEEAFTRNIPFINVDSIARQIAPERLNDPRISIRAGRQALVQMQEMLLRKQSFAFETTLSSKQSLAMLQQAKAQGYLVELHYIGLADCELSIERVAQRVAAGGHDIPRETILRRYDKSLNQLPIAMRFADIINLYDNSGKERILLYESHRQDITHHVSVQPSWVQDALKKFEKSL
ncbi:MAG: zeta toxin family protein [Cardiobacteriaceae bacterium]|nr:zeta toxin family protein [Cardiobacteriaceae bacterium]